MRKEDTGNKTKRETEGFLGFFLFFNINVNSFFGGGKNYSGNCVKKTKCMSRLIYFNLITYFIN